MKRHNYRLPPAFHEVFLTVLFLSLVSFGASFWLASQDNLTPQQVRLFENCSASWNMGAGVIFGLLGAKAKLSSDDKD